MSRVGIELPKTHCGIRNVETCAYGEVQQGANQTLEMDLHFIIRNVW